MSISFGFGVSGKLASQPDHDGWNGHSWLDPWLKWGQSWPDAWSTSEAVGPRFHYHRHNNHAPKEGFKPSDPAQDTLHVRYLALLGEEARHIDGTGNNLEHGTWGSAGSSLLRVAPASYADGIGAYHTGAANPRDISNAILDQDGLDPSSFDVSDLFTFFGQFIDHDIDLTPEGHGPETMGFSHTDGDFAISRSGYQPGTGETTAREYPNVITSYVDASNIYGSHADVTSILRAEGGASPYLLTSEDDYAPTLGQIMDAYPDLNPHDVGGAPLAAGGANPDLFIAGDVRANENIALTAMHTVWLREHNHQVDRLKQYMPDASDDELFKAAKLIVGAEYQNIVFNEYLPLLLGAENIPDYSGYDETVNAGVRIEFSTAAYRLGHSQISPILHRLDEDGGEADGGSLGLFQAFFNPTQLLNGGIDALVRGLGAFRGQDIDENIIDDVRNLLFGGTDADPIDLGVFNILRSYDHGVPSLNEVRVAYGLTPYQNFSELTSDMTLQAQFLDVYDDIDEVELWVGGLAEDTYWGSQLGETFHMIVLDQFMAFRDGDRFYFEHQLDEHPELLAMIKNTSFSDILLRTTGIDHFQDDAFIAHNRIGGDNGRDILWGTDAHDLMIGSGGRDRLYGEDGDDDLYGGKGEDRLDGGTGRDVLVGGDGRDTLIGGSGPDIFVLDGFNARDHIADYEIQDTIDLTRLLDIFDSDGEDGLTQGDVDNAVSLNGGDLDVKAPGHNHFETVAHIDAAGGGHPNQISVLVDDGTGHEATFVI